MTNKQILGFGAVLVSLVGIIGLTTLSQASQEADWQNNQKPNMNPEHRQEMLAKKDAIFAALDNNDYQAWLEAVGADSRPAQEVTEQEFPQLIEAHKLVQEGKEKFQQAKEIKEAIGLKSPPQGKKLHKKFGPRFNALHDQPEQ